MSDTSHINIYSNCGTDGLAVNSQILTFCLSGMNGTLATYRACEEVWRIAGLVWPYIWLRGTSTLLVTLIVLLRVLMVIQPLNYQDVHKAISRIGCIVAWVVSLLVSSTYFIVSLPGLYDLNIYNTFVGIVNHGLGTAPILLTVLLYAILLCSLNPQANRLAKSFAKMTHGIVIGLIVCNIPGLIYISYVGAMLRKGNSDDIFTSNTAVRIVG